MRLFKVVIRRNDHPDIDFRFNSVSEASGYFDYLVKFEIDHLISNVWSISLVHGKRVLKHYNNFLNVLL